MPNTTSRLGLSEAVGADAVTSYRTSATSSMAILDSAMLVTEGTLAGRPAAATVEKDRVYKATDTGQWFITDQTNWYVALIAGSWQALTLPGTVSTASGSYAAAARLEGDSVRLRGAISTSSAIASPGTIATIPSALAPTQQVVRPYSFTGPAPGVGVMTIHTSGVITTSSDFSTTGLIAFDGVAYTRA